MASSPSVFHTNQDQEGEKGRRITHIWGKSIQIQHVLSLSGVPVRLSALKGDNNLSKAHIDSSRTQRDREDIQDLIASPLPLLIILSSDFLHLLPRRPP